MNPQTDQPDQQTQQPASPFSALPPPDPLLIAQQQLADTTEKLRRAEQRIIALDAERGKLTEIVAKIDENPLVLALRHLDCGAVLTEAGEKTAQLFALCQEIHGAGKVKLTVSVKPMEGKNRALVYSADVAVVEPKAEAETAIIFTTPDGGLTRSNWGERELPLRPRDPDADAD